MCTPVPSIVETSIIIEHLQLVHPGPVRLLPSEPIAALSGDPVKRREGLAAAEKKLELAYAWLVWLVASTIFVGLLDRRRATSAPSRSGRATRS